MAEMFHADLVIEATAYAIHPDGAEVPPPIPAEQAAPEQEK